MRAPLNLSDLPDVLTAEEVARVLRVGRSTVYEWAREGLLPVFRIRGSVRFSKAAIAGLLAGQAQERSDGKLLAGGQEDQKGNRLVRPLADRGSREP